MQSPLSKTVCLSGAASLRLSLKSLSAVVGSFFEAALAASFFRNPM